MSTLIKHGQEENRESLKKVHQDEKNNSRSQNVPESVAEDQKMEPGAESQTEYLIFLLVLLYWELLIELYDLNFSSIPDEL